MPSRSVLMPFSTIRVPNKPATAEAEWRIAFVGEAPGDTETVQRIPFVGASGHLLERVMHQAGIMRSHCLLANVFQYQPYKNDIKTVDRAAPEWAASLARLSEDLQEYKPNLVVLLGATALETFTGQKEISNWRGSIVEGKLLDHTYKCLPAFHPAHILRSYGDYPLLQFDLERAAAEGKFPEIIRRQRKLEVDLSLDELLLRLDGLSHHVGTISFDIEGGCNGMHCISFATSPEHGFNVPFLTRQGNYKSGKGYSVWSRNDEITLIRAIDRVFRNPNLTIVAQNGITYDQFVLAFAHGLHIVTPVEDTMILSWELFPEQPKSLGFQNSIWTTEPYYKGERKSPEDFEYWRYCVKDSCTTLEVWEEQNKYIDAMGSFAETVRRHYRFNRDVQRAMLYCSLRGMVYDEGLVGEAAAGIREKLAKHQAFLDEKFGSLVGFDKPKKKKRLSKVEQILLEFDEPETEFVPVGKFNCKSTMQLRKLIYDIKGYSHYSRQTKKDDSTDEMSLLTLAAKHNDPDLWEIIKAKRCRTALSSLGLNEDGTPARKVTDSDGRVRFSYNVVGTDTGRTTCYRSNSGSGFNGQTITKTKGYNMRKFYRADPGHLYFQGDLEGADSWTVAAQCAALGDDTMLRYLKRGIKPAKVMRLTFIYDVQTVLSMPLDELALESKKAPSDELYVCCKRIVHGTSYKMGPRQVGDLVFKDSEGTIHLGESECRSYQRIFLNLFPGVELRYEAIFREVSDKGFIICASGHMRTFMAIRWTRQKGRWVIDHDTHRAALSTEPQSNTTYVTNQILHNLYYQPYNRTETGFILEPLHQVHDAVNGQSRKEFVLDGSLKRVWETASDITLDISGYPIKIPVDAKLGSSWGDEEFTVDGKPASK